MWKIKHENTAWHSSLEDDDVFDIPDMDDLKGASHDAYFMNQRLTSETFRYKFLNYNRSWLVNQLPSMLTPRTLKRSRPYLINQFSRILNSLNRDISSDSEEDVPEYGPVALTASSRKIIRWWLAKARKQVIQSERALRVLFPGQKALRIQFEHNKVSIVIITCSESFASSGQATRNCSAPYKQGPRDILRAMSLKKTVEG